MELFFFGFWEIPVGSYLVFYCLFGIAGFALCLFHRYFIALALLVIGWFAFKDFSSFFASNVGPGRVYIAMVGLSIILAILASFLGTYLSIRRVQKRNQSLP